MDQGNFSNAHSYYVIYQTRQNFEMLPSQPLTQIQPVPVNSVRSCNFNPSLQLLCKFDL